VAELDRQLRLNESVLRTKVIRPRRADASGHVTPRDPSRGQSIEPSSHMAT
jgi:ribosomal protein S6